MSLEKELQIKSNKDEIKNWKKERTNKILSCGHWFTGGVEGASNPAAFEGKYNIMNGTITFSDGEYTYFSDYKNADAQTDLLIELGFERSEDMYCPHPKDYRRPSSN